MLYQEHYYEKLRPVKYKGYFDYNGTWIAGTESSIGRFHGWGIATVRNEKITVAIVEIQTGEIKYIEPEDILFTDTLHHVDHDNGLAPDNKP